ncbi:nuclear receptor-interacting protein 2 isoform X2 [Ornithorhynchus anatinus]|uniref:nuclear receptor-interacting protein 2 isoform X2 n=1 Tax=Ornithorhynchus anatinus TaxID=9258 RepID=UPI0010A7EFC4|nr:nuclear receptor-interacting protein 2 isoform X2 [Ornithorhynchus anatinus]
MSGGEAPGPGPRPALLSQQRRLKQASRFAHQDSADLLPLDSLKRLGTSKDLPHSVIQRRLEGDLSRLRTDCPPPRGRGRSPDGEASALLVHCKCGQQGLTAAVDTSIPHNLVSADCLRRLGLEEPPPGGDALPAETPPRMEQLELQLGPETVVCSAVVVEDDSPELRLGLRTLQALKCCIDLERGVLRLRGPCPDLPFLPGRREPGPPPPSGDTGP